MMTSAFVPDQYDLDSNSANLPKEQSVYRHVAPLGNTIPIPSQPVFALIPFYCMHSTREASNTSTNFKVFGFTLSRFKSKMYNTLGDHGNIYTIDV